MPSFPQLTLQHLYNLVGKKPKQRARNTQILAVRRRSNLKRFVYVIRSFESYSNPKGHIVSFLYPNLIPFDQLKYYTDKLTPMNRRVRVHCTCPAWQFTGPAFMSTRDGYRLSQTPENRPAHVRDPAEENYICKHVAAVIDHVRPMTFVDLLREFTVTARRLLAKYVPVATPIITRHLMTQGWRTDAIDDLVFGLNEDNLEDTLDELGMLVQPEDDSEGEDDGDA